MSKISTATLRGESGKQYPFDVYRYETMFRQGTQGVYLIARRYKQNDGKFTLDPIFIGHSKDLSTLYGFHPKQHCLQKHYPNCTCVFPCSDIDRCKLIVQDLIAHHEPHCN